MKCFRNINELISDIREEKSKSCRFATRFILVQGCRTWDELVAKLIHEVDRVVHLSEFCDGHDVFPDMTKLQYYLKEKILNCKDVLLIPLAECIRLDPESAIIIRSLAEWPAEKIRRLYIPLLSINESFLAEMDHVPRYEEGLLPDILSIEGEGDCEVVVAPFHIESEDFLIISGIKEYLSRWESSNVNKIWLQTDMAAWLPKLRLGGRCKVCIYPSPFDYVSRNANWEEIREEWGSSENWNWLATQMREGESLDSVASRILNVADYNSQQLFVMWKNLDERKRWLVWLWSKAKSNPDSYLYHVIEKSNSVSDFIDNVIMAIFSLPKSLSFSMERKELLKLLGVTVMPPEFWKQYDELSSPLERIAVLTDLSVTEREKLVSSAGELLSSHSTALWWDYLEVAFPKLTWYLEFPSTDDEFADAYFFAYNRCRLIDRADDSLHDLIDKWASEQLLWNYQGRSDIVAKQRSNGSKILWVDAMGAEWLGLLIKLLTMDGEVECEVMLARANIPTITDANKEWEEDEEVIRDLDDIAHHYAYTFPQSFLKEMELIDKLAIKVQELLSQFSVVVVTSDHGLSRFAAISKERVDPPQGTTVDSRGRFAALQDDVLSENYDANTLWVLVNNVICLLTHCRFKGCMASPGEVHGGAAPEECLSPVIAVRKAGVEAPLKFELIAETIKLNPKGEGVIAVRCNRAIRNLKLQVAGSSLKGQEAEALTWEFKLKGWKAGKYTGTLYSANRNVGKITFEAVKGFIQDDLGL